ncbi:MAG TPA: response regulator [Phycisphaerae bacterium]|nr:response regulator [Phycisphaerae bacterium]
MRQQQIGRPVEVLLVEDNPGDARLTEIALQAGRICNRLHLVTDGEEAMAFLRRQGPHADAPRPDIILLDLNLPKKDGREVLAEIDADAGLRQIPVVVLTTSRRDADLLRTFDLGAKFHIVKPVDIEQLIGAIRFVDGYWSGIVEPPGD